jgi:hypothetical protein
MDRLTNSDWWWDVAFDGIASSLLTATLAFIGIAWTLRHDRRMKRREWVDHMTRDLLTETRQVARLIREERRYPDESWWLPLDRWSDHFRDFVLTPRPDEDVLDRLLAAVRVTLPVLVEDAGPEGALATLENVGQLLSRRLHSPEDFDRLTNERQAKLEDLLRVGKEVPEALWG